MDRKKNPNILLFFLWVMVVCGLLSCVGYKGPPKSMGAWVVYWDGERGLKELDAHGQIFDRVSLFAYELGPNGGPQQASGVSAIIPRFFVLAREKGFSPWVTLVNDWQTPERVFLKETERLKRLLSDQEQRRQHIRAIVELVVKDGFSGLDLDYEGFLKRDNQILAPLVVELAAELKKRGLGFNVVVEPRTDRFLPLAGTASLVVMGYNLHGPHSGPGPRATPAFIRSLTARGKGDALGKPTLTLALGGFSWGRDQKVKQLDWETGNQLAEKAAKKGRGSGYVPYAKFEDGGVVWFEDEKSLMAKWKAADGFEGLMLWHLGGNDDRLFRWLDQIKKKI